MAIADLGFGVARCRIEPASEESELCILEPASQDTPANSFSLVGLDAILRLRDCIEEALAEWEQRQELELDTMGDKSPS